MDIFRLLHDTDSAMMLNQGPYINVVSQENKQIEFFQDGILSQSLHSSKVQCLWREVRKQYILNFSHN